jgi:hypothetical protein
MGDTMMLSKNRPSTTCGRTSPSQEVSKIVTMEEPAYINLEDMEEQEVDAGKGGALVASAMVSVLLMHRSSS